MTRNYEHEIAEHEAAIVALRKEQRDARRARFGLPPVRTPQETGREGGLARMAKYGRPPVSPGRRRNPTYDEIMATTGGLSASSARTGRASARPQNAKRPGAGTPGLLHPSEG